MEQIDRLNLTEAAPVLDPTRTLSLGLPRFGPTLSERTASHFTKIVAQGWNRAAAVMVFMSM